jgi:hypothetical protein
MAKSLRIPKGKSKKERQHNGQKIEEQQSLPQVFSESRLTRSLIFCGMFGDRCLSFCLFSFGHCVVCPSIYGF